MDIRIEPFIGMYPLEVVPLIFQEQINDKKLRLQDFESIGFVNGLVQYGIPRFTKESSEALVKLMKLEDEVNPLFFYYLQQEFDKKIAELSGYILNTKR